MPRSAGSIASWKIDGGRSMAQVTVNLNGRDYTVGCGEGEESRLRDLAREVDARLKGFVSQVGQIGEARLLVLTLLSLADELAETANEGGEIALAAGINALAQRVETVAARLESAKM
jgi:cell division protein ZapA